MAFVTQEIVLIAIIIFISLSKEKVNLINLSLQV